MLGTAKFRNIDHLEEWFKTLTMEDGRQFFQSCVENVADRDVRVFLKSTLEPDYTFAYSIGDAFVRERWQKQKETAMGNIRKTVEYSEKYGQPLCVREWHDGKFALLHTGNPDKCVVVPLPERFLDFTPIKDYSGITPAALRAQLNASGDVAAIVPADADGELTQRGIQSDLDAKIAELIDGAPSTLDTLGEIARALQEGGGISDALDAAIGTKASQAELDSHTENDTIHISASERTKWNEITALISHIASKATAATLGHVKLSDTYTSTIAEGAAANGMGASQKAVADTYSSLSSRLSDSLGGMTFGVDEDGNYGYIKAGADSVTPFRNGITKIASFSGHWNTDEGDVTLSSPLPSLNVTDYILVPTEILTNTGNTGGMNSPIDTVFVPQMTIISNTKVHIKMGFRKTFTADWGSQFLVTHVNGDIYYIK